MDVTHSVFTREKEPSKWRGGFFGVGNRGRGRVKGEGEGRLEYDGNNLYVCMK
jgi:hypothetical protein